MATNRNIRITSYVVFTLVFLVGIGTSWIVFYGFSLFERDVITNQNTQILIGDSFSEITNSTVESDDLAEKHATSTHPQIRTLEEIAKIRSPLERNTVLLNVLRQSNEDRVLELFVHSKQLAPPARLQTQAFILQRLVRINPLRALLEVQEFQRPQFSYLLSALFSQWAQFDLDTAVSQAKTLSHAGKLVALKGILQERSDLNITEILEIAQQLGHEQFANDFTEQKIISEAQIEPERVWKEIVETAQSEPVQIKLLTEIAKIWVEQTGMGALDQIRESLDNSLTKSLITTAVVREVSVTHPSTAIEYALNLDHDPYLDSALTAVQKWAESDPHSVLDELSSIEQTGQYWLLLERLVKTWAAFDPRTLLRDLDSLPSEVVRLATNRAIASIAGENPTDVFDVVSAMEDKKDNSLKLHAARSAIDQRGPHNMDSVLDWILYDTGLEKLRSRLLTYAMFPLMNRHRDPERALNAALELPLGENEIGPEVVVVAQIANRDMDKAIEYMSKVRDGPTKTEAYSCLGFVLARKGLTDRALKLLQQVPDYAKEEYLAQVFGSWATFHPNRLIESLDELPSTEIASTAAFSLLFYEPQRNHLSPEQIETVKTYLSTKDAKHLE